RHRQLFLFAHEIEQHEDFVAQAVVAVRRNGQTPIFHERHVRQVERTLVLDRERQQPGFVTWTSQNLKFPKCSSCRKRGSTAEQQSLQRQLLINAGRRQPPH